MASLIRADKKRQILKNNSISIMKHLSVLVWTLLLVILIPNVVGAATSGSSLTTDQKRLDHINDSLNTNVSQCENFAEYACGGIRMFKESEPYSYFVGNLELFDSHVMDDLTDAVGKLQSTSGYKFLRNINNFYKSCKNRGDLNDFLPYLKWMNTNTGIKWPMAEGRVWHTLSGMDWVELLALTRKYGFNNIFVYEDVTPLSEDSLKMAIEFKRPPLEPLCYGSLWTTGMTYEEFNKFEEFEKKLLETTLKLIEVEGRDNIEKAMRSEMPGSTDTNPISLKDLGLPWVNKYVQVLLEQSPLDLDTVVYVQNKEYLQGLGMFLSRYDNRFLSDYIQIKFLKYLRERNAYSDLTYCMGDVRDMFPLPMQWLYKSQHPELQKQLPHIKSIFDNLKATFKKSLTKNVYNFPTDIVKYLQTKIDSIELSVDAITAEALEELYRNLSLSSTDYYGNRLKLFQLNFNITHSFLSKRLTRNSVPMLSLRPTDIRESYYFPKAISNLPYLFPRHNLIHLPLTLLQDTYYEPGQDDVYSYSTIGFLLAHQIVTAFDSRYLRVDAKGRYNTTAAEVIQTNRKFAHITQTLREKLSTLNGDTYKLYADVHGLKLAHDTVLELHPKAWLANVTLHGEMIKMNKVFFMSFAQNYCGMLCEYSLDLLDYSRCQRATVATQNLDSFSHAFGCGNSQSQNLWP